MKRWNTEEICIYVLELEDSKYYVGQSIDLERRFRNHLSKYSGAEWTRMFKPIRMLKKVRTGIKDPAYALKYENELTFEFIRQFGWQNVRGGDFTSPNEDEHLFGLIKNSRLGNEVCPVEVVDEIDVNELGSCVFTLELMGEKYFVGTTKHLNLAILNEVNERGAYWTKRHKPMKLIRAIEVVADLDFRSSHLDELKRAFLLYNFRNVRGGIFNKVHLESHREMVFSLFDVAN